MADWTREKFPLPSEASDVNPAIPVTSKHCRWVECPIDRKFYIFGGDFQSTWQGMQSGQNSLLTYDPARRAWEIAYPFWGKAGERYPMHMDEAAVCWDSSRNVFWLTNGYQGGPTAEDSAQAIGTQTRRIIQTFDPVKRSWTLPFGLKSMDATKQHMRTVYDAETDRILGAYYDGGSGTSIAIFDPKTGSTTKKGIKGLGNYRPSTGQTNFLIDRKLYFTGGRSIAECDTQTGFGRTLVTLPSPMYPDQDFSYLPELNAFLIWDETPAAYLVDRSTGELSPGPPSPLLKDGSGYRPQHNNRHSSGIIVIGWSAAEKVQGRQVSEYWHYTLSNAKRTPSPQAKETSSIRATITTTEQAFPSGTKPANYRFGISGPEDRLVDVPYGQALQARFDDVPVGTYTVTVELLDSAGMRLGNLLSQRITVAEAEIILQLPFGLTSAGIRIRRAAGRTSTTSDD